MAFVWVTALAYQLEARSAWVSVFTPLNFMLTFLSAGTVGACFFAAAFTHELSVALLAATAILLAASWAGQLMFTYYVAHVGYHVDVHPFMPESRVPYALWLTFGVALPAVLLAGLIAGSASVVWKTVGLAGVAVGLIAWQAFFFITGKEVWYFPQYDKNLSPDYF